MKVRTIARWHVRETWRSALVWGLALASLSVLEVAIYPSVHKTLAKVVNDYPPALKQAFNVHDLSTVQAFLDVEMFSLMIPLAAGFFAIRCATRETVTAEERNWLDVLLAAPLERRDLVAGVAGGTLISLALLLIAIAVPTEIASVVVGSAIPLDLLAAGLFSTWALGALCAGLAAVGAGLIHRGATVTAGAMGVLVAMYVLDLVGKLAPSVDGLRWASVFRYTEGALKDGLDPGGVALVLAVAAGGFALGGWLFDRKDLR